MARLASHCSRLSTGIWCIQSVGGFADMEKFRALFKLVSTRNGKKDKTAGRYA
jgi:hypothetical protein